MSVISPPFSRHYKSLAIFGYPMYRIGDDGSLWSLLGSGIHYKRAYDNVSRRWKEKTPTSDGLRVIVSLTNNKGGKTFTLSRLVLLAFVGPCPEGMEACHNDGNHRNNRLSNLRWDTHVNNEMDKKLHGTNNAGERSHFAKLDNEKVKRIREQHASGKFSLGQLARMYHVAVGTIHPIIHRKTWKHI